MFKIARISVVAAAVCVATLLPARAWDHGGASGPVANSALSGLVLGDASLFPFVNFMKMAGSFNTLTAISVAYPNYLQQGTNLPTGTLGATLSYGVPVPNNYTGQHVISMPGASIGGATKGLQINSVSFWGKVYSIGAGTTLSGCSNGNVPPCTWNGSLTIAGTNPNVTFDFSTAVTSVADNGLGSHVTHVSWASTPDTVNATTITVSGVSGSDGNGCGANGQWSITNKTSTGADLVGSTFPSGCTYTSGGQVFPYSTASVTTPGLNWLSGTTISGLTSLVMCKLADYNADNTCNTTAGHTAWAGGFNDDFIASLAVERPHHLRFLDLNRTINSPTAADWANWQTTSAWSYNTGTSGGDFWAMQNWFNTASGTNAYSIDCTTSATCTYTLTGGVPQDGDYVQFYNQNANTSANVTLTLKDASSVTSSAIPLLSTGATQIFSQITGTITAGDQIILTFATTPVGAGTCLSGGTHTTSPYTVLVSDTTITVSNALAAIVVADTTLSAQNLAVVARNPNGNGTFQIGYASHACNLTVTASVTGSATEVVNLGTQQIGAVKAQTLYGAVYNASLGAFIISNAGGQAASWPWIVQIQLAQAVSIKSGVQVGCWLQPNMLWSNASFTSLVNLANSNRCPGGTAFELANEVWNFSLFQSYPQSYFLGSAIGLKGDIYGYYEFRQRQLWAIASSAFGGLGSSLQTISAWQVGGAVASELIGTNLCGTSCGNQAYQNAIGVDYNVAPNRPIDFTTDLSDAPYYRGAILNGQLGVTYTTPSNYGSWSATSSSISSNVLTVSGTVTGTIWWNQGVAGCDGAYIAPPSLSDPTSAQLTGKVTTTLNGALATDNIHTWTLTSTSGVQVGMSIYNATTGSINATVLAVNSGLNQITAGAANTGQTYRSAGSNDTIVFGGLAGTYQLNSTSCSIASGTITGGDVLGLQYAADNYNGINGALGSAQDAYNWFYIDILASTLKNQAAQYHSLAGIINLYQSQAAVANQFSKTNRDYEGGYDGVIPTAAQATTMGLPSSSYGGTGGFVDLALNSGFKHSATFKAIAIAQHNQELSFMPAGSMGQWYAFTSNSVWAIFPGGIYSTPYQSYNAICTYNGGTAC